LAAKLVVVLALGCGVALAQVQPAEQTKTEWLTVAGDALNAGVNTIQVDPVLVDSADGQRTMRVRVSRSAQRASWDGIPYRSFDSYVAFDCGNKTARYLSIRFYAQPQWKGEPRKTQSYTTGEPRMMEFRDIQPNPNTRIINAACAAR